jgi:hypothetical protein
MPRGDVARGSFFNGALLSLDGFPILMTSSGVDAVSSPKTWVRRTSFQKFCQYGVDVDCRFPSCHENDAGAIPSSSDRPSVFLFNGLEDFIDLFNPSALANESCCLSQDSHSPRSAMISTSFSNFCR